ACDPPTVDEKGNLSTSFLSNSGSGTIYFEADGTSATIIRDGRNGLIAVEDQMWIAPRESGFALLRHTFSPWCDFIRPLAADGRSTGGYALVNNHFPDHVRLVRRNPAGGFVMIRTTDDGHHPPTATLDVRWLSEDFTPQGDWQTAITYHQNIQFAGEVDVQG